MHCYRLSFSAPFHVDSRGNNYYEESGCFIHSDTLSSAISAIWSLVDRKQARQLATNPGFKLSSAFPFYDDCYFLPRVANTLALTLPNDRLQEAKKLKKIQWLQSALWLRSLRKQYWSEDLNIHQGVLATTKAYSLPESLWIEEERPRLAMDRNSGQALDGQLFNFSRIWFHPKGGLYFLAQFDDDDSKRRFEMLLSLLGDSGIGADRSNGNGCFKWDRGRLAGIALAEQGPAVALSLVNPDPADCQGDWLEGAAYKLVSRGGWIGQSGQRKQRLRMFAEGSVFANPLRGRLADVSNDTVDYAVYRDGRGFFVKAGES